MTDTTRAGSEAAHARSWLASDLTPVRFLLLGAQLALLVAVMSVYRIEELHGWHRLLPLLLAGFLVHCWLPRALRLPFFLALSLVGFGLVLGPGMAARLVAAGLVLVGICHLRAPLWARVSLLLLVGAGLAALRLGWVESWSAPLLLPILGSMFMFRLIVYLYDLGHEKAGASPWQRLAYFFLLPNVCFPLFPVVDWSTFRRTYYDAEPAAIYQKGLDWIARGVVHLVLYRLVYYQLATSPAAVRDALGAALYMLSAYLLYLRVSGQFHLIIGVLCLFGFNLPETHHLYYLASGFNDFWRRINIYWKDFVMKLFYYPLYMKLRKHGTTLPLVVATMATFVVSWLLHSYQWFWLRGSFPLTATDASFWLLLGALVAVNSVIEARTGRRGRLGKPAWSLGRAVVRSLKTVGFFCFLCLFWALWNGASVGEWLSLLAILARPTASEALLLLGVLAAAVAAGVLFLWVQGRRPVRAATAARAPGRDIGATVAIALVLLAVAAPWTSRQLGPGMGKTVASLRADRFNQRDKDLFERGYYEALIGVDKYTSALWQVQVTKPADWKALKDTPIARPTDDILGYELKESDGITFKRASLHTNRWGMRDRDYEREKPPGAYRIAVVGASYVMGAGVDDDETFETVVEARLNGDAAGVPPARYEVLNFGVAGYTVLEVAAVVDRKVAAFQPDAVLYVCHLNELARAYGAFARKIQEGVAYPYPDLLELQARAGIARETEASEAERRARPLAADVLSWGYELIVRRCREVGAVPVWVFLPATDEADDEDRLRDLMEVASRAGFLVWRLDGVYGGEDRMIQLAAWDKHPNGRGHRLIGERLVEEIRANASVLRLGTETARNGQTGR